MTTLAHLTALPEPLDVLVVDNASGDGTAGAVVRRFPQVRVVRSPANLGAAARNIGVGSVSSPYVAFSDDDSWWEPGALARACDLFDDRPGLGLIAGRILVGERGETDPTCLTMATSPLPSGAGSVGPSVLGFLACGAVVRRRAFLQVGGFHPRLMIGGEERLLAIDLSVAGWVLAYVDDVVARHHPAPGPRAGRRRRETRNAVWTAWLRRRALGAIGETMWAVRRAGDPEAALGLLDALGGWRWVLRERRPVPAGLDRALALVDGWDGSASPSA